VGADSTDRLFEPLAGVNEAADLLLLAGDVTRNGEVDEAHRLVRELRAVRIPVIAVLGNHDYHQDAQQEITAVLQGAGIVVLECSSTTTDVAGVRVGVTGCKGFGGGFVGACASDYGEPEMKAFTRHGKQIAARFGAALDAVQADVHVALLHYSPVVDTLRGERLEIYPFLGSYLLAEEVDRVAADLVVHGHAHAGSARGRTAGGIPVRNVAQPVIQQAYALFCLGEPTDCAGIGWESVERARRQPAAASAR
jgi:Icc-related predicted phosphoesterase